MSDNGQVKLWTPANIVTMTRILLIPIFVVVLLSPWPQWFDMNGIIDNDAKSLIATGVFILISCTDWIDGYLARSRNEVTDFGKFVDPLADKILVAAALLALVELQVLPSWPVLIILTREFIVSGIRMIAASKGVVIAASWFGKIKTVLQIVAIVLFLIKDSLHFESVTNAIHSPLYVLSWLVMLAALFFTILSMIDYIAKAKKLFFSKRPNANIDISENADRNDISQLSAEVIEAAKEKGLTICTAESLTGGMISEEITSVSGSSQVFLGGIASYAISVKEKLLDVNSKLLAEVGAVDGDVAMQMAKGSRNLLGADICVSVTGIAGPGGAEPGKPVGTVYLGIATKSAAYCEEAHFEGGREAVRVSTTYRALELLKKEIDAL